MPVEVWEALFYRSVNLLTIWVTWKFKKIQGCITQDPNSVEFGVKPRIYILKEYSMKALRTGWFGAHRSRASNVNGNQVLTRNHTKLKWKQLESHCIYIFIKKFIFIQPKKKILWELDSIIGKYVSWGIFNEMKQSIIFPKKAFQLLEQTHTALSVPRHKHKHKMRPRR